MSQHHLVTISRNIILDVYAFWATFPSHLSSKESRMSLMEDSTILSYLHGKLILWANHYKVFQYLSFSGLGEREKEDSETFIRANYSRKEYNLPWNPPTLVCIGRPLQKAVHRSKAQTPDLLERSWPLCCLQEGVYLVGLTALKLPFCKLFALSLDNSAQAGIEDLSWLETFMEILQMVP